MDTAFVQALVEAALAPLQAQIEKLEAQVEALSEKQDTFESTDFAPNEHYHDEYAHVDHVERSENAMERRLYRIEESVSTLEYELRNVERTAEHAQQAADSANRGGRYY